jgi:plasmid stabilization system protein ParE
MASATWTPIAETDIEEIYAHIAFHDGRRRTAKGVVRQIRKLVDDLATTFAAGSVLGTEQPNLGEAYRIFSHKRWVVVFRPIDAGIEVVRVVDGSRDYDKLFGS